MMTSTLKTDTASLSGMTPVARPATKRSVWQKIVAAARAWRHRRTIANLYTFDDTMLRDIGLNRGDVASALSEPLFRDASDVLARRASESRAAYRAQAREALQAAAALRRGELNNVD
ncbi:DUF1127 domain-containing protein [Methylovirgula sp. 4M-Z18]|uniref:DUF1127 domain-containing protein n=1 Tax=Methylovirgula sp. 4M-Z18 TaxID=2293567 RepID=UPI000E2FE761|nr:DUF1127 domain-containing protein [Methylovirgula sp. 4M-Z18]RFB78844.1 DUF1127 domain-containing protein [Methylovirgula sp. 4M-Z18]